MTTKVILTLAELDRYIKKIRSAGRVSLDTETTGLDIINDRIVGVSLSVEPGEGVYIPVRHSYLGVPKQLKPKDVFKRLKPVLEDRLIVKAGHNLKYDMEMLAHEGVSVQGIVYDTKVMAYLIAPNDHNNHLDYVGATYGNISKTSIKEIIGTGKKAITMDKVEIERAAPYAVNDAIMVTELFPVLHKKLKELDMLDLYLSVEMPLISILAEMERAGIKISRRPLDEISTRLSREIQNLEAKIYTLAGHGFNINSPKQLAVVLFNELHLPRIKVTDTGQDSTDEDTLLMLKGSHPIIPLLLAYRKAAKIKSTYTDKLPTLINKTTGRLHCQLKQCVTATGRLASSDPNLQNIPARDAIGQEIRKAFVAEPNHVLLVADYSQIELRLLAHLSGDQTMLRIFKNGGDIHQETANAVFKGKLDPKEARHKAKIINFSINYGTSPRSLAKEMGCTVPQATDFIARYFRAYPRVRDYQQEIIQETDSTGYSITILGRRRPVPELQSDEKRIRKFGERIAMNTPIQGSAADVVKVAMIQTTQALKQAGLKTRLLLQVHDELIFEVPKGEVKQAKDLIKKNMEDLSTYLRRPLSVELTVSIGVGQNWTEGKE